MIKRSEARKENAWNKAQNDLYDRYYKEDAEGDGYLACSAWDAVHVVVRAYQDILAEVKG